MSLISFYWLWKSFWKRQNVRVPPLSFHCHLFTTSIYVHETSVSTTHVFSKIPGPFRKERLVTDLLKFIVYLQSYNQHTPSFSHWVLFPYRYTLLPPYFIIPYKFIDGH